MRPDYKFDHVPVNPNREKPEPIGGIGIPVGTIREVVPDVPKFYTIPCQHCGHVDARTEWQSKNRFHCYECGEDTVMNEPSLQRV